MGNWTPWPPETTDHRAWVLPLGQLVEDAQKVDAGEDVAPAVGGSVSALLRSHTHRQHRCNSFTADRCTQSSWCVGLQFHVHMYAYMPTYCLTCSHTDTHTCIRTYTHMHAHQHQCNVRVWRTATEWAFCVCVGGGGRGCSKCMCEQAMQCVGTYASMHMWKWVRETNFGLVTHSEPWEWETSKVTPSICGHVTVGCFPSAATSPTRCRPRMLTLVTATLMLSHICNVPSMGFIQKLHNESGQLLCLDHLFVLP